MKRLRFAPGTAALAGAFLIGGPLQTFAQDRGPAFQRTLHKHGALDDYMADLVAETAGRLVEVAGRWPSARVNLPFQAGHVNVYLVDGARLPVQGNILAAYNVDLTGSRFANALVDEGTGSIFMDTRFLKGFVAYRMLVDEGTDPLTAAALVRVDGIDGLRQYWDPTANPVLRSRRYRDKWLIAFRGMLGMVVGHELGHITLGPTALHGDDPLLFASPQERDLRWACPDLVADPHRGKQDVERWADDYAVPLMAKILFPDGIGPPRLLYEIGAHQYLSYLLKGELLNATLVSPSPIIQAAMRARLGAGTYARLLASGEQGRQGAIHVFYPRTHPATLKRSVGSLSQLAQSPASVFYGEGIGIEGDFALLDRIVGDACRTLARRHPPTDGGMR